MAYHDEVLFYFYFIFDSGPSVVVIFDGAKPRGRERKEDEGTRTLAGPARDELLGRGGGGFGSVDAGLCCDDARRNRIHTFWVVN